MRTQRGRVRRRQEGNTERSERRWEKGSPRKLRWKRSLTREWSKDRGENKVPGRARGWGGVFGHIAETDLEDESQGWPGAAPTPRESVTHDYALGFILLSLTPVVCEPSSRVHKFLLSPQGDWGGWEERVEGRPLCSEGISRRSCTLIFAPPLWSPRGEAASRCYQSQSSLTLPWWHLQFFQCVCTNLIYLTKKKNPTRVQIFSQWDYMLNI